MPAIKTADRVVVSVTATGSGDWQVVDTPTGYQGITSANFSDGDIIHGFLRAENGVDWEVYDGDTAATLLVIQNVAGTVTITRPATPFASSNNGNRISAGSGTHTLALGLGAGTLTRLFRETNPTWQTFTSADSTPSVASYRFFNTAGTTTITRFDNMETGKLFYVRRASADITIQNNADIVCAGGADILLTAENPVAIFAEVSGVARQLNGGFSALAPNRLAATELTIASGAITPTRFSHSVDTEADAASDDLSTITGTNFKDGDLLMISAENASRDVVVKASGGNIVLPDNLDITLDDTQKTLLLRYDGASWNYVAGQSVPALIPNAVAASILTIASGAVTLSRASHALAAESGTADTVTSFVVSAFKNGDTIKITADTGDTITIDSSITDDGTSFDLDDATFAYVHVLAGGTYLVSQGGGGSAADPRKFLVDDYPGADRTAKISAMIDALLAAGGGKWVLTQDETIDLSAVSGADTRWKLINNVDYFGIEGNGYTLTVTRTFTGSDRIFLFEFDDWRNIDIRNINLISEKQTTWGENTARGLVWFYIRTGERLVARNIYAEGGFHLFWGIKRLTEGDSAADRPQIWDISNVTTSYLGYVIQQAWDGGQLFAKNIRTDFAGRSVFLRNVDLFDIDIFSTNNYADDILISADEQAQSATRAVRSGRLKYKSRGSTTANARGYAVALRAQTTSGGNGATLSNIDINLDVDMGGGGGQSAVLRVIRGLADGSGNDTGTDSGDGRGHVVENLRINGVIDNAPAGTIITLCPTWSLTTTPDQIKGYLDLRGLTINGNAAADVDINMAVNAGAVLVGGSTWSGNLNRNGTYNGRFVAQQFKSANFSYADGAYFNEYGSDITAPDFNLSCRGATSGFGSNFLFRANGTTLGGIRSERAGGLYFAGQNLTNGFTLSDAVGLKLTSKFGTTPLKPSNLTGNVNDWNPTGLSTANYIRVATDGGSYNITGLAAGYDGQEMTIQNGGGAGNITLVHEDAGSTGVNRFYFPGGTSVVVGPRKSITLVYNADSARWWVKVLPA